VANFSFALSRLQIAIFGHHHYLADIFTVNLHFTAWKTGVFEGSSVRRTLSGPAGGHLFFG
jgi:hypothetical protein